MPVAANIVLADAQATPVSRTFTPVGPDAKDPTLFWFEDQSAASPIGFWRISVKLKRPSPARANESSQGRVNRVSIQMWQPILETVSNSTVTGIVPAPTLSYIPMSSMEFVIPERASLLDRQNLRKMTSGLVANSSVTSVIENLQGIF